MFKIMALVTVILSGGDNPSPEPFVMYNSMSFANEADCKLVLEEKFDAPKAALAAMLRQQFGDDEAQVLIEPSCYKELKDTI